MSTPDREALRAAQRADAACQETFAVPPVEDVPPPHTRIIDPCDTPPAPVPEVFYPPVGQPIIDSPNPYRVPAISVGNTTQTAHCSDLISGDAAYTGNAVTVAANTLSDIVLLQNIPDLLDSQGRYLASLSEDQQHSLINDDAATIANIGKLSATQAQWVFAQIAVAQSDINSRAFQLAVSQLDCSWKNTQQEASCPTGAVATGASNTLGNATNPGIIAAGAFLSKVSQADADSQALAAAQALLVCIYQNTIRTKNCTDADVGFTEAVPNDTNPLTPALDTPSPGRRVGQVTISAGTVFSLVSIDDANAQADTLANSQLNCFYVNAPVTLVCANDTNGVPPVQKTADPALNVKGSSVTVPANFIVSRVSTASANADAEALAAALLDCYWLNHAQVATCAVQYIDPVTGDPVDPGAAGTVAVPADSVKSPVYTATTDVGIVSSTVSQADADAQALTLALAQLNCVYCNTIVLPHCVPTGDNPTLPVTPDQIGLSWSRDVTPGVPAGTYCAADATTAQQLAGAIGNLPVRLKVEGSAGSCTYGNVAVQAQCIQTGPDNAPMVYGMFRTDGSPTTGEATQDPLPAIPGNRLGLSPESYPNPYANATVIIPKDLIIVTQANVPASFEPGVTTRYVDFANLQAISLAKSFLNCFWINQTVQVLCGANAEASAPTTGTIGDPHSTLVFGNGSQPVLDGSSINPEPVAVRARGSSTAPITISSAVFQSTSGQNDANQRALELGLLQLDCYWINTTQSADCQSQSVVSGTPPNTSTIVVAPSANSPTKHSVFEAGLLVSYASQHDADAQAQSIAQSQLQCLYCNSNIPAVCTGSLDETEGIGANAICTPDAASTLAVASAIANTLISVNGTDLQSGDCSYGNDPITASCIQSGSDATPDVVGMFRQIDGSPFDQGVGTGVDLNDIPASSLTNWGLSEGCYPRPGTTIKIAKNTITVTVSEASAAGYSDAKAYANALARTSARSQMNCFFGSEIRRYYCDGHINDLGDYNPAFRIDTTDSGPPEWGLGSIRESGPLSQVDPTEGPEVIPPDRMLRSVYPTSLGYYGGCTSTVKNPLLIKKDQFISYVSRLDLNNQIRQYALAALDCYFMNQPLKVLCGAEEPFFVDGSGNPDSTKQFYYGSGSSINPNADGTPNNFRHPDGLVQSAGGVFECSTTVRAVYGTGTVEGVAVADRAVGSLLRPVFVKTGLFRSKESLGDANDQGLDTGIARLECSVKHMPSWGFGCKDRVISNLVATRYFTAKGVAPITASDADKAFYFDSNVLGPDNLLAGSTDASVNFLVNVSHYNCWNPGDTVAFTFADGTKTVTGTVLRSFGYKGSPTQPPYNIAIQQTGGDVPGETDVLDTGQLITGGGQTSEPPFDMTISVDSGSGAVTARFVPGSVAGLAPTNILESISVPSGSSSFAFVEVSTDGKTPLSSLMKIETGRPAPVQATKGALPVTVPIILHIIDYKAPVSPATVGTYTPYRFFFPKTNIQLLAREVFRTSVTSPTPGTLPYDPWYNWIVCSYLADLNYVES